MFHSKNLHPFFHALIAVSFSSSLFLPLHAQTAPPAVSFDGPAQGLVGEKLLYQAKVSPTGGVLTWFIQPADMGAVEAFPAEQRAIVIASKTGELMVGAKYEISGFPPVTAFRTVMIQQAVTGDGGATGEKLPLPPPPSDGGDAGGTGGAGGDGGITEPPPEATSDTGTGESGGDVGTIVTTTPPTAQIVFPSEYVIYPGTILLLSALPADVTFTWSAAGGIDVNDTGLVTGFHPGFAKVRIDATVTVNGQPFQISDEKTFEISAPIIEFYPPAGAVYEGHEAIVSAEAYPPVGSWQDFGLVIADGAATIENGPAMNVFFYKDTPAAGCQWIKAEGKIKLERPGDISVTATYVIPHATDPTKQYSRTLKSSLTTADISVIVSGARSVVWKHCPQGEPDAPSGDSPNGFPEGDPSADSPVASPPTPSAAYRQGWEDGRAAALAHIEKGTPITPEQQQILVNGWNGVDDYSRGFYDGYVATEMGVTPGSTSPDPGGTGTQPGGDPSATPTPDSEAPPDNPAPEYPLAVRCTTQHDHGQVLSWIIGGVHYGLTGGGPISIQKNTNLLFSAAHLFTFKPQRTDWCGWFDLKAGYRCEKAVKASDNVLWISYHTCCQGADKSLGLEIVATPGQYQAGREPTVVLESQTLSVTANELTLDAQGNRVASFSAYHWNWSPKPAAALPGGEVPPPAVTLESGSGQKTATFRFDQVGRYTLLCWAAGAEGAISNLAGFQVCVERVDLDVDLNRDGMYTWAEDNLEEKLPGLILHVNEDNDDEALEPADQKETDYSNDRIDGDSDWEDLKPLAMTFPFGGWSELPPGIVRIRQAGGSGQVRIFKSNGLNSQVILSPGVSSESEDLWTDLLAGYPKFHIEGVKPGAVTLELEYANGPIISKDRVALSVIRVEIVRGDVDTTTGRGALGKAKDVIHSIPADEVLPASHPVPHVVLENVTVSDIRLDALQRFVADLTVSGYATFALSDIVPEHKGDLATAELVIGEKVVDTIALVREAEPSSLLRPYAAKYNFSKSVNAVPVLPRNCRVEVTVEDSVVRNVGSDSAQFDLIATQAPAFLPEGGAQESLFLAEGLGQPFKFRLDFGMAYPSLAALQAAGGNAISFAAQSTLDAEQPPITAAVGLQMEKGANLKIRSADGQVDIQITDDRFKGLAAFARGRFSAVVRLSALPGQNFPVLFEETAANSNVFCSRYVEASLTLEAPLSPAARDKVSVVVTKILWDTPAARVTGVLEETDVDSKQFGPPEFRVAIEKMTTFSALASDEMVLAVTHAGMGLAGQRVDAAETGPNTLVFETDKVLDDSDPFANEYSTAWLKGPWKAGAVSYHKSRQPGHYVPLLVRVQGPPEVASSGMKCEFFGATHDLVVDNGEVFSAGSPKAGNFAIVGHFKDGDILGAGHICAVDGFVWASLRGAGRSKDVLVDNTASRLFEVLKELAGVRRKARYGSDPGASYWPPTYLSSDYPQKGFALVILDFLQRASAQVDPKNQNPREKALEEMTMHLPEYKVLGIPNAPNKLWVQVLLDFKAQLICEPTIGSPYLLGHWHNLDTTMNLDFVSQKQGFTQQIHFNVGMGWETRIRDRILELRKILEDTLMTDRKKCKAITNWLTENDFTQRLGIIKKGGFILLSFLAPEYIFRKFVDTEYQWRELVDVMTMSKAFGRDNVSAMDFFLAYDVASLEGFHLFGIDALNDVIATDAGDRFGRELAGQGSIFDSEQKVQERLAVHFKDARTALSSHRLFSGREKALKSFYSVMMAEYNGNFVPVVIFHNRLPFVLWRSTIGTIISKNKAKLNTQAGREAFLNKVKSVIESYTVTPCSGDAELDETDFESLHQAVDVLSFINQ